VSACPFGYSWGIAEFLLKSIKRGEVCPNFSSCGAAVYSKIKQIFCCYLFGKYTMSPPWKALEIKMNHSINLLTNLNHTARSVQKYWAYVRCEQGSLPGLKRTEREADPLISRICRHDVSFRYRWSFLLAHRWISEWTWNVGGGGGSYWRLEEKARCCRGLARRARCSRISSVAGQQSL
jgi:hypothetical protein